MAGVRLIDYRGKRVLIIDLANCEIKDIAGVLAEAKRLVLSFPLGSVIAVTDVTGTKYNRETIRLMSDYAAATAPYTKAGALVGVTDLKRVIYNTIMTLIRKKYPIFDTVNEALDWLVEQ